MWNQLKNLTEQLQKAQNKTFTNKTLNNKKRNRFLTNSSRKISSYENTDTDIESGYKDEYEQEQMINQTSHTTIMLFKKFIHIPLKKWIVIKRRHWE